EMTARASLVHEFDVVRWLLGDEYETVHLVCPRKSCHADPDLADPQVVYLRTRGGVCVDLEMFMNGWYGYDLQCEVVGEEATIRLPDPANLIWRKDGFCGQEIFPSWSQRFESAYETEIREWARHAILGCPQGPSAWDGYQASLAGEFAVRSLREGRVVEFPEECCPEFYQ
ncbi:MAG: inositol 2-dehydrogenase, partial [Planctomycetota bacterium]|nr:inositol 2-dehydrogenase [Planctomycetota bacterium]